MQRHCAPRKPRRHALLTLACLGALGQIAPPAGAAERTWKSATGGLFSFASSWAEGAVPGPNDNALFNTGADTPYTVAFSLASPTTDALSILSAKPTFSLA